MVSLASHNHVDTEFLQLAIRFQEWTRSITMDLINDESGTYSIYLGKVTACQRQTVGKERIDANIQDEKHTSQWFCCVSNSTYIQRLET